MTFLLIQAKQAKLWCQPEMNLSCVYGNHQPLLPCGSSLTQRWWQSRGKSLHRGVPTTAITAQVKYLDWYFRCNFSLPTGRGLYRYNLQVQNTLGKQWTSNAHCPLLATSGKLNSKYRRIIRAPAAGISIMLSRCSPSLPLSPHLSVSHQCVRTHGRKQPRHNRREGCSCKHQTQRREIAVINVAQKNDRGEHSKGVCCSDHIEVA